MTTLRPALPNAIEATVVPFSSVDFDKVVSKPSESHISSTLWTCAVCLGVPRNPIMLKICGHVGCRNCFYRVYKRRFALYDSQSRLPNSLCPTCRRIFLETDMVPYSKWEPLSRGAFDCVEVACADSTNKIDDNFVHCKFVGSIQDLLHHELRTCANRTVKCPNPGCRFIATYSKLPEHFKECDKLVIYCHACNLPALWIEKENHQCIPALRQSLYGKE
jgi:hypothetical protein